MYKPSLNFKRTPEEKADQLLSWQRDDQAFFAAGACHILAYTFLKHHTEEGFKLIYIKPLNYNSGNHMYVSNDIWAFDYAGWTLERELLAETEKAYAAKYPGWKYDRVVVADKIEDFCKKNNHRLPEQFAVLPWERADKYLSQFRLTPPVIDYN